jgi:6-phosphogluconolactonase
MTPHVLIGDPSEIQHALMSEFERAAAEAIADHGTFFVALSGGSIAPLFFPSLARLPIDWSRTDFFWADERAVAPEHPDSNYGEALRLWLTPAGVPAGRIHRMPGEDPNLRHAGITYGAALRRIAGDPPALDFVLLGVGLDGHVASLFPGHPALKEEHDLAVAVEDAPKPPPRRITLTLPVLAGAAHVVVAAQGDAKAEVVRRAVKPGSSLPLGMLISRARDVRLLLVK